MANIQASIQYVLENEGGYTVDDGGPTNYGIVEEDLATFLGVSVSQITAQDIKDLTVGQATAIYKKQYWDVMQLDSVTDQNMATAIFDMGVNMGVFEGARLTQAVVGVAADGIIGPITLAALNATNAQAFIPPFEQLVIDHYLAIEESDPAEYEQYLRGWENRAKRLLTLV
jgi:lysozyme family protein